MSIILATFSYVMSDPFFIPSMAFTVMVGIFIGAVIYNGDVKEIKKALVALSSYIILISAVNLSRTIPQILVVEAVNRQKPLASVVTTFLVSLFYLAGMAWGIRIVKKAHNKHEV